MLVTHLNCALEELQGCAVLGTEQVRMLDSYHVGLLNCASPIASLLSTVCEGDDEGRTP